MNALIAPMSSPIILFANCVSAYPAARGAKIRPRFHPNMAMCKRRKIPYTPRPTAVPKAMHSMASRIYARFTSHSLKFMLFVFDCGAIGGNKDCIAHCASKVII